MISRLIFGALGDLTSRYLVPALAQLWQAGQLLEDFCVTGVGRRNADSAAFRQEMAEALDRFAAEVPPAARQAVCARLEYRRADSTNACQVAAALAPVELDLTLAPQELPAYARLLLDVLRGAPTLSIRADEAEESWRIVEPILGAWAAGSVSLGEYPAGSTGPANTLVPPHRLRGVWPEGDRDA